MPIGITYKPEEEKDDIFKIQTTFLTRELKYFEIVTKICNNLQMGLKLKDWKVQVEPYRVRSANETRKSNKCQLN